MPQYKKNYLGPVFVVLGILLVSLSFICYFVIDDDIAFIIFPIGSFFTVVGTAINYINKERRLQYYREATQYQLSILNQNVAQINAKLNSLLNEQPEKIISAPSVAQTVTPTADTCPNCGNPKIPNNSFCIKCGAKLQ